MQFCHAQVLEERLPKIATGGNMSDTISIGTSSFDLYIFYLLKLPPPPRAAICYIVSTSLHMFHAMTKLASCSSLAIVLLSPSSKKNL